MATKAAHNTKSTEAENKITNTADLITTLEFNRLAKISFYEEIKEAAKKKTQVDNPFFRHLIYVCLMVKVALKMMNYEII